MIMLGQNYTRTHVREQVLGTREIYRMFSFPLTFSVLFAICKSLPLPSLVWPYKNHNERFNQVDNFHDSFQKNTYRLQNYWVLFGVTNKVVSLKQYPNGKEPKQILNYVQVRTNQIHV